VRHADRAREGRLCLAAISCQYYYHYQLRENKTRNSLDCLDEGQRREKKKKKREEGGLNGRGEEKKSARDRDAGRTKKTEIRSTM